MKVYLIILGVLVFLHKNEGAADYDVERVSSPYVDQRDLGPLMSNERSSMQSGSYKSYSPSNTYNPQRSYSSSYSYGHNVPCVRCHQLRGTSSYPNTGSSSSGSTSSRSSSYHSGSHTPSAGVGRYYDNGYQSNYYPMPLKTSSSRHELNEKQEFVDGQQVYDLHHEKRFKDGQLVYNNMDEKSPEDFGVASTQPAEQNINVHAPGSRSSGYSSSSSYSSHQGTDDNSDSSVKFASPPYTTNNRGSTTSQTNRGSVQNQGNNDFDRKFQSDIERLQEEMRRQTVKQHQEYIGNNNPTYGGSHRTEYRTQTKYINGKPVYIRNEQRKYKDGKLVHDTTEEEDLNKARDQGAPITGSAYNKPYYPYPYGSDRQSTHSSSMYRSEAEHRSKNPAISTYPSSSQHRYYNRGEDSVRSNQYGEEVWSSNDRTPGTVYRGEDSARSSQFGEEVWPSNDRTPGTVYSSPYNKKTSSADTTFLNEPYTSSTYSKSDEKIYDIANSPYYNSFSSDSKYGQTYPQRNTNTYKSSSNYDSTVDQRTNAYNPAVSQSSYEARRSESGYSSNPGYKTNAVYTPPGSESQKSEESRYQSASSNGESYRLTDHENSGNNDYNRNSGYTPYNEPEEEIPEEEPEAPTDTKEQNGGVVDQERYDISPYDDVKYENRGKVVVDEAETPESYATSSPDSYNRYRPGYSASQTYEESKQQTDHSRSYVNPRNPNPIRYTPIQGSYTTNSSEFEHHQRNAFPSRWIETRTTWKYVNGILASETQYHKYFENGVIIHQNTTERTRDQMAADGVDVMNLDLTPSTLALYGPAAPARAHSQKHEIHQVKSYENGQPIYELNHERLYQDGDLIHENHTEKNAQDFEERGDGNHQLLQSQHLNQQAVSHAYPSSISGSSNHQQATAGFDVNPNTYIRRHELRQEQEFVDGQKVYDLHHEKEYQDGKLVKENKTELGPDDFGTQKMPQRDALKNILSKGKSYFSTGGVAQNSQQRATADRRLTTTCITCNKGPSHILNQFGGTQNQRLGMNANDLLAANYATPVHTHNAGGSFRKDIEVEEVYENGQLVKGKEEKKQWRNGQLVDHDAETYFQGPSRVDSVPPALGSGPSQTHSYNRESSAAVRSEENECISTNPCLNQSKCRQSSRGPLCLCKFGFKGIRCEEAYCPNRFCRHGGTCSIIAGTHECQCPDGYKGERCATREVTFKLKAN